MDKFKSILLTIISTVLAMLTLGLVTKTKREAKKKFIDDRKKEVVNTQKEFEKKISQEKKKDESKSIEQISDEVDSLLDDDKFSDL